MRGRLALAALAAAVAFGVAWPLGLQGWLSVHTGTVNEPGVYYGFFSGFGSIVIPPVITAAPIVAVLLRKHNCHVSGCWRIGSLPVEGTTYVVCRHHHPDGGITAGEIRERLHMYIGKRPGRG